MSNERPQLNDKIGPKILSDGADAGLHGPRAAPVDHHTSSALAQNSPTPYVRPRILLYSLESPHRFAACCAELAHGLIFMY